MRNLARYLIGLILYLPLIAQAEPWISNRYAQNCAGCHAPGRKNLEPMARRCTLACQGCHVNPNGGGLRSFYGKWNEDRWLRSFSSELLENDKKPAPYKKQIYAQKKFKPHKDKQASVYTPPLPLVTTERDLPEKSYDKSDGIEHITSKSHDDFMHQVPVEDPIYAMLNTKVDGGADVRWQLNRGTVKYSDEETETKNDVWANFLMSADIGLRWRPVHKRYHLVYEGRYLGNPTYNKTEQVAQTLNKRNLYLLVDDLPYATFGMVGYYRPLFGNYVADHTALSQRMQSYALQDTPSIYNLSYQAATLGGSPNVPFANLHVMTKQFGAAQNDSHFGYALNLGGRFVTLGASFNYSFWNSQKDEVVAAEEVKTRVQMHSLSGGMMFWRVITNLEIVALTKDKPNDAFSKGMVATLDTYTQLWRENYFTLSYAQANLSQDLKPGSATQFRVGLRSFLTPGVDTMLLWNMENSEVSDVEDAVAPNDTVVDEIMWQLHLYI